MLQITKAHQLVGHNASVFAVVADHDPRYILSGAGDGWLVRWDLEAPDLGKLVAKVETQIFSMCLLAGERRVVVGNMNGGVHWVDLEHPEATKNIAHHQKGVYAIVQVGPHVFTGGGDGLVTRWSVESGSSIESLQLSPASIRSIAFAPERNELAVGASDHSIYFLDASRMEVKYSIPAAHDNSIFCLKYSPDQKQLWSGGRDAHLKIWDLEAERTCLMDHAAHWYTINDLVFDPSGKYVATGSRDKTIRIWDAHNFKLVKAIETIRDQGHINSVNRLLWSSHKNYLISASDDRRLISWAIG